MKVTVVSRSGREVIKGGIELHDEVPFLLLHCFFLLERKDWFLVLPERVCLKNPVKDSFSSSSVCCFVLLIFR